MAYDFRFSKVIFSINKHTNINYIVVS